MLEKLAELIAVMENNENCKSVDFTFENENLNYKYKFNIEKVEKWKKQISN